MKKVKRKICIVTGTRAEYGILKSVMKAVQKSEKLTLQLLAVGMHLVSEFGRTIKEIKKDGFDINDTIEMTATKDTAKAMAQSIGKGVIGIADSLERIKPDIIVVLGDRTEALATTIAAVYSNIVVAHIHGGDNPQAGLDEYARHAITKMAHIHFPATKKSAVRIAKMGEDAKKIFIVGAPGLDAIFDRVASSSKKIAKKYKLDLSEPILLVIQHPVTTEIANAGKQIRKTLEVVRELKFNTIIIYPNADAGGRRMIKVIEKYRKYPFIQIHKSIPRDDYLGIMKIASVMIGNSSSGIIESPVFHLPVVNIGLRQKGRERTNNIIDVTHNKNQIKKAIRTALYNKKFLKQVGDCKNPYGNGKTGINIVKILEKIKINKNLLQKKLTY